MRNRRPLAITLALALALSGALVAGADVLDEVREPAQATREAAAEQAHQNVKVDLIDKIGAPVPFEGVVNTTGDLEPKRLFFHGRAALSTLDEADEFTGGPGGPYMDPTPPTETAPKVAYSSAAGNPDFRKNPLNAYWGGQVTGFLTGNPKVTFWVQSAGATRVEVSIFGDGGIGSASPLRRELVDVLAPAPTRLEVTFTGLEANIEKELVVQIIAQNANATRDTPTKVFFDSTEFPSSFSFLLGPISVGLPKLDDPFGIAFRGADLVAANSGTGDVVTFADGKVSSVLKGGLVPGGFARGVTGLAVDAGGTVYAAVAETGEVLFVKPDGGSGTFARGLGAPTGLAFGLDGNLYAADNGGKRVVKVDTTTGAVSRVAALSQKPYGLAFAPDGTLTVSAPGVSSSELQVRLYSVDVSTGTVTELPKLAGSTSAEGIAYGASGNLFIGSGRSGQLLRLTPAGAVEEVAKGLGGPINLAFAPGTTNLVVATQGEGRTGGDGILTVDAAETGLPLAAPVLAPVGLPAIPRTWVHQAGAQALDPATFAGTLPEAGMRSVGQNGFEPTLGVQNDGDVFIVGGDFDVAGGVLGSPKVYRSRDAGKTWTDITPKDLLGRGEDAPPVTLDPYLWVDTDTDRVFTIDLSSACLYLSFTDDDGDHWTTNPVACGVPPVDHQTIVTGKPRVSQTRGYPNILYHCSNWVADSPCGRSLDGGRSWEPAGIAYVGTDAANRPGETGGLQCGGLTSHLATDPEGRVFLPRGHCGRPYISVSEDDGLTWTAYPVSTTTRTNQHETAVASDTAGNLYYVWIGTDRLPYLATSTDHGRTWSAPKMVAPPGVTETNIPTIASGAPGTVAVLYMGSTVEYGYRSRNYGKAGWNGYITVSTSALSADPVFTTTTANPLTDPLVRGTCGPSRCQNVFDFLDIIVAPDGRVWATFVDTCTGPCSGNRSAASTDGKEAATPLVIGPNLRTGGALAPLP